MQQQSKLFPVVNPIESLACIKQAAVYITVALFEITNSL